ncbi:cold-shock protein [Legionella quateirensis]|uniref:Cold shock protein CspD n=1 Tax=Legionella quateirensis TaxID=45072 RepID=A0A378KTI6_9GAMM|nr:cold-shock protein [Legionella quateirensis]KTD51109.1 cold shock protein CspD [Legionella quateirensis]STY17646.1 cold shock protein CspD [Legionella quateirensis]
MHTGIVNRFNKIKGYGFITPDESQKEIFVHFSEIQSAGYKELKEGQRISYVLGHGERGEFATQVMIIS